MSTSSPDAVVRTLRRVLLATALAVVVTGCGLTAPRSSDGFANLDSLGLTDTDLVMSLSLGPAILGFAARHVDDDPQAKALLSGLDGVRIRIYEVNGDAGRVGERMARMSTRLQDDGWEPVVLVRKADEEAHMLLRIVDGRIHGMTVLVLEDDAEAVVINLMGDIRPEQFGDLMVAMDVDSPGVRRVEVEDGADG